MYARVIWVTTCTLERVHCSEALLINEYSCTHVRTHRHTLHVGCIAQAVSLKVGRLVVRTLARRLASIR